MRAVLTLLLPGLIPSWEFFKTVEPSPRIEWRLIEGTQTGGWLTYRPRPDHISVLTLLARLFWNPRWNEGLYLVGLAERLTLNETPHSRDEIERYLTAEVHRLELENTDCALQFRLVFVSMEGARHVRDITHTSEPRLLRDIPHDD